MSEVRTRDDCRLCHSTALTQVVKLRDTPLANAFSIEPDLSATRYPLELMLCRKCGNLQLRHVVDPGLLFRDYRYVPTGAGFLGHFRNYAEWAVAEFGLRLGDLVIDIGSNDGTLLKFFRGAGIGVLGVEPAGEIASRATQDGISTLVKFWGAYTASQCCDYTGCQAKLITANNVFAHVDDLDDFVEGVRLALAPDGAFVFEVQYALDLLNKGLADNVYHEHLNYHSVRPLGAYFAGHGMHLAKVSEVATHGGSIRCVVRPEAGPRCPWVGEDDLTFEPAWVGFNRRLERRRAALHSVIQELVHPGEVIAAYGAPAKATTLLWHFGLQERIAFCIDDNPLKQGCYLPGTEIPIFARQILEETSPDVVLILAWNFADEILSSEVAKRYLARGGRFIVPLPRLRVVGAS